MHKYKTIRNLTIATIALIGLSACSGTAPLALLEKIKQGSDKITAKTINAAAKSIDGYCKTVPKQKRTNIRNKINAKTIKGDIFIACKK